MISLKTIRSRNIHKLLQQRSPSVHLTSPPSPSIKLYSESYQVFSLSSISWRLFSSSAQCLQISDEKRLKCKKPLSVFFKESVGISEKTDSSDSEDDEKSKLKDKLRTLSDEVRSLNKKSYEKHQQSVRVGVNGRLSQLFDNKRKIEEKVKLDRPIVLRNEDSLVHKELSPDMQMFAYCLYEGGYLKDANFVPGDKFDASYFVDSYARQYLKFAALKFAKDHQEIAKWLSASDLKKVASFGCPSVVLKTVHAAKNLREFFKIEEAKVCQSCVLKDSCKLANKRPQRDASKLQLSSVIRLLIAYALELVPQQLLVPEEIKSAVSLILKEVVSLSKTVSLGK